MKKIYLTVLSASCAFGSVVQAQLYANKIVFSLPSSVIGSDSVCTINPDGTGFAFVTHGARPRVSNHKNTLAFLQGNQANRNFNDIYFKEGNAAPYVFFDNNSHQSITNFDFSPHDHYFMYDWDHGLYFTESDNPTGQSFAGSCSGDIIDNFPRISATDSALVVTSPTHGLYLMPVLQNGCAIIPNTVGTERSPYWSADGQWIYFLREHTSGGGSHNIYKIKRDGSSLTQITNLPISDTLGASLVITQNGKWAVAPARINGVVGIYKFRLNNPNSFGYLVKPFPYLHTPIETLWLGSVDSVSDDMSMSVIETEALAVNVFPNPGKEYVQVTLGQNVTGVIQVYNATGMTVMEQKIQNSNSIIIHLDGLASGVYTLQGDMDGKRFMKRIIKQ